MEPVDLLGGICDSSASVFEIEENEEENENDDDDNGIKNDTSTKEEEVVADESDIVHNGQSLDGNSKFLCVHVLDHGGVIRWQDVTQQ